MDDDLYLVLYDISDPKRLAKAADIILDYGIRIQESVYEVYLNEQTLRTLKQRLSKIIKVREDGVKMFPLCKSCMARRMQVGTVSHLESSAPWIVL